MTLDEHHRVMAVLGRELWGKAMASPDKALAVRMRHPVPGDLVLEISRLGGGWDRDSIGILRRVEGEPPADRWVVSPLHEPDLEQGWRNATFIALPTERSRQWLADDAALPHPERSEQ